jgi:hypothetical protein
VKIRTIIAAALWSLFVCLNSALAAGDTVAIGKGAVKIGNWNVTAKPQAFSDAIGTGSFAAITASSTDSEASPVTDADSVPAPMPYRTAAGANASYATKQTQAEGIKYKAQSKVAVDVTDVLRTVVHWQATAATFGIEVLAPTGVTGETASASWSAKDPMNFDLLSAGDLLEITFTPDSQGWDISLLGSGSESSSSAGFSGSASTTLAGYEDLFGWSFLADSSQPGVVEGGFFSNPLLGWDDAAITAGILARFSYDSALNDFAFDASGLSFGAEIAVPDGVSSVSVTTSLGATLTASSAVPENANSVVLLALALGALSAVRRSIPHSRSP